MSISVSRMPDILKSQRSDGVGSISVLRALKNILEVLETTTNPDDGEETDRVEAAIDDCNTMIAAIALGRDLIAQSI